MANTIDVAIITTANTFDHWRIRDNLIANDVNEIARGNFVKPTGSINIAEGTLTLANSSGGVLLSVKDDARIDGVLSVDSIESDQDGHVYLAASDITMGNRAAGGLFQANINTKFDSANVVFSNSNVHFTSTDSNAVVLIKPNTTFQTNAAVTGTLNVATAVNAFAYVTTQGLNVTDQANTARITANNAYEKANGAANSVAVFSSGTLVLDSANLNFNNTASINVGVTANGTAQINVGLTLNANSITEIGTLTALNVSGTANITTVRSNDIRVDSNATYSILSGNATFNNLDVRGNLVVIGTTVSDTDLFTLRGAASSDGDGVFRVKRGSSGKGNAEIRFNSTSDVWQATANANGSPTHYSILTTQNVTDSVISTSTVNAAAPNSVKTAYDQATNARDQANNSRDQANTARTQANTARDTANGAYAQANGAYAQANGAYAHANIVYAQANTARDVANASYGQANAAYTQANNARSDANATFSTINTTFGTINTNATNINSNAINAYVQANNARDQANSARDQANTARTTANDAYTAANSSANTVATHANGTLVLAAGNLNFNNTDTINIGVTANGSLQTNVSFSVNTSTIQVPSYLITYGIDVLGIT